jgi:hypothetical protein
LLKKGKQHLAPDGATWAIRDVALILAFLSVFAAWIS